MTWAAIVVAVAAGDAAAQTAAQMEVMNSGRRTITAERMRDDERIVLDGVLDEPVWGRAEHGGEFIMQDPVLGGTPTERTEVRIVYNRDHLYIGATLYDSEPDKLKGNTSKRDEFLSADDRFMWTIDTFLNQQTGYFFEMNPSGLMADALKGPTGSNAREWDGIWNARVRQSEIGWVLEIDLPFRSLAFDPNAPAWGINFQRTVRRKQEELLWTGHQRNQGLQRMANAGLLVGLKDVSPGRGFELRPYASGYTFSAPGLPGETSRETSGDVGIDMAYNLTPSLRGVATVNTDFAETEVDQRLVNLTRFPLFLPERRTFFLDGATFFDLPFNAFFSRRIGLVAGLPKPIIGGGKLNGQAGKNDVGALYVRTAEDEGAAGESFLVGRWRRRILRQSYFGGFYTGRTTHEAGAPGTRTTFGADFRLATATFLGNKNLSVSGYWVGMSADPTATRSGTLGDRDTLSGRVEYLNDIWEATAEYQDVGALYNPAVGFTPRREYRLYDPEFIWSPRPKTRHPYIRRLRFGINPTVYTDLQNRKQSIEVEMQPFRIELHSGDNAEVTISPAYERLDRPFEIAPGVVLPGGSDYRFRRYKVSLNTANQRIVALRPEVRWGTFFSGRRQEYQLGLDVRPRPGVRINTTYEYNRVNLPEGKFDTRLLRVVTDTQFSPFMYLVNNVQYDSVSRVLGWQARYRWIVRPGNDVFFVYTHNWIEDRFDPNAQFATLDRRAAAKVVYTKRF
ncbi:MAG: DUF5916 domain-containing protein [Vicinamibacterales bacterium]